MYSHISDDIHMFADDGRASLLFAMLPIGIAFGAVHALTPGHGKAILASYVAGSPVSVGHALLVSLTLAITHVGMAVLIALFSLPLVSVALGSAGRAPALEFMSRGLLLLVGMWMVWRAMRNSTRHTHEGKAVGLIAGLVPCPLTLFVMTLAMARGVPQAGLAFAVAMVMGVAATLSLVALVTSLGRRFVQNFLLAHPKLLSGVSRVIEGFAGVFLTLIAVLELNR